MGIDHGVGKAVKKAVQTDGKPRRLRVFAVYGHEEAARLTFFGLFALQHRGRKGDRRGRRLPDPGEKRQAWFSIFQEENLKKLPGTMAIGHVRYPRRAPP